VARRVALVLTVTLLTVTLLAGCGSSVSYRKATLVSDLTLDVVASEQEIPQHLMVVGESASPRASTQTRNCLIQDSCPASVDVEIRSSNPAVAALGGG